MVLGSTLFAEGCEYADEGSDDYYPEWYKVNLMMHPDSGFAPSE